MNALAATAIPTLTGADVPSSEMCFYLETELLRQVWAIDRRRVLATEEIAELIELAMIAGAVGERVRATEEAARLPSRREREAASWCGRLRRAWRIAREPEEDTP
jgi:hypothetical protein